MNGDDAAVGGAIAGGLFAMVIVFAVMAVMIASMWKMFVKAGQPGWAALVPIYNLVILLKIAGKPTWWLVLFCIPFANFYALIMVTMGVAKSFGKSTGFAMGMLFLGVVFYPMLAFSDARYEGAPLAA